MWDFAVDGITGDWLFSPAHDYLGATGPELTEQRIAIRCRVPRGSPIPQLGSRLRSISGMAAQRQLQQAEALVNEAVQDMADIVVTDISAHFTSGRQIVVVVSYHVSVAADEVAGLAQELTPTFDARVTL